MIEQAITLARTYYNLEVTAKKLPGEVDYNFYLQASSGEEYTLKVTREKVDITELEFQVAIMQHLEQKSLSIQLPTIVPANTGEYVVAFVDDQGKERWLRLQRWVSGDVVADVYYHSPALLKSWGRVCGEMCNALADFDHSAAHRFYKWNPSETLYSRQWESYFQTEEQKEIANYFWTLFETHAQPQLPQLRHSIIYNDANDYNVLVDIQNKYPTINGVIDFGDVLYTATINDLAIACAYACMDKEDPLEAAAHLVAGFHEVYPLQEEEIAVLFPMITARLMITVANAAWNKHCEPDNEYLLISERPAWDLLKKLSAIPVHLALYTFRAACGWEAAPQAGKFREWLSKNTAELHTVMQLERDCAVLDLSVSSLDLGNNDNFATPAKMSRQINTILLDNEATMGIGGYGEIRPFYTTDAYRMATNEGDHWRTMHLGVDVWATANTPVFAPWDGEVYISHNNEGKDNYGPTIVLKHEVEEGLTFYTLYGHLSIESLSLEVGAKVAKGQQIATLGDPSVNGNWPPHLHFQIVLDMLGQTQDFFGVALPQQAAIWQSICPDPMPFVNRKKSIGRAEVSVDDILTSRHNNLGRGLSISYSEPLHMVRGYGQYLYDTNGRRYLDTVNNVAHVGHENSKVVKAAQRQMAVLNTNTRYLHKNIVAFAEELLTQFPPELCVVHFVNSGSEANELALRMARTATDQQDIVALEVGYHGNTGGCIDISSYKFDGKAGKGAPEHTSIVPIPDTYRGLHRDEDTAGEAYANYVEKAIEHIQAKGRNIAGFIAEPIVSCGGQVMLPKGYLESAYKYVRAAGGVCISDEVQVGFGRVGEHFWGFELQGVVPDIVTMGKPIGNGHPLAAVVTTRAVADAFANGMEYFNTFGGNPVSCAIGRSVLQAIKDEKLQENARDIGAYLTVGLKHLQQKHPIIGEVRGVGLFLGFELVKDRETLEPAAEQAAYLADRMRTKGILMSTDGPYYNVLKIKPPICFNQEDADYFLRELEDVLQENFMRI